MTKLLVANIKMIVRDRQTLLWALMFPVVLVVMFGLFRDQFSSAYFNELVIGLAGFAVMFNSIIVVGVKISSYRQLRILRRILVTPLPMRNYFAAEIIAHLFLALFQSAIILVLGIFAFGAEVHGNILWFFLIVAFANIVFLNIGFAVGGRSSSPAAASGIANAIAIPMMFLSGTFFPTSTLPAFLPELMKVLPLTPTLDALRMVAIDGDAIWKTWPELSILAGWVVASTAIACKIFKFD